MNELDLSSLYLINRDTLINYIQKELALHGSLTERDLMLWARECKLASDDQGHDLSKLSTTALWKIAISKRSIFNLAVSQPE